MSANDTSDKNQDSASLALRSGALSVSGANIKSSANAKNLKSVESANALLNLREKISQNTALVSDEWLDRLVEWFSEHCKNPTLATIFTDKEWLKNATRLGFRDTDFDFDDLPAEFANLWALNALVFDCIPLKRFPQVVCELAGLKTLTMWCWKNCEPLAFPSEFEGLQSLECWELDGYKLREFPKVACGLKLRVLTLCECALSALPREFAGLKSLSSLDVSGNDFKQFPNAIASLAALSSLYMDTYGLSSLPDELTNLQKLSCLDLSNNFFGEFPKAVFRLENLADLQMNNCALHALPQDFARLQNLQKLELCDNNFTEFPQVIFELKSLKELHINAELITPKIAEKLENKNIKLTRLISEKAR